ncbi:MAG: hypothetical protein Q8T11_00655 [Elusimicrobiota bacterium]|nr:hypothetical protein [Elusimicrobiota bacterium]
MKWRLFAASLLFSILVVAGIDRAWTQDEGRGGTAMPALVNAGEPAVPDVPRDITEDRRVRRQGFVIVLAVMGFVLCVGANALACGGSGQGRR